MNLEKCTLQDAWGGCDIRTSRPPVETFDKVYYLPFGFNAAWGIFDRHDQIVQPSIGYSGPENHLHWGQVLVSSHSHDDIAEELPDAEYVYGGYLSEHFGHFIVETLPRLWPLAGGRAPHQKIVFHSEFEKEHYFKLSFVRDILGALNIGLDDVVQSNRPFRISRLSVPSVSFQQQSFGHPAFAELCHAIGRGLMGAEPPPLLSRPVYLSKTRLKRGLTRLANEEDFQLVLQRNGVEVVYPEELSLVEQLNMLAGRRVVSGTVSSAFHSSIFTPTAGRFEVISQGKSVNSNYFLIDALNDNYASYYAADCISIPFQQGDAFARQDAFVEPAAMAEAFAELLWQKRDRHAPAQKKKTWLSRLGVTPR